jgi:two-component system cell cycle sensor histidine kinase/response regulator CckA
MDEKGPSRSDPADLRHRAEELLRGKPADLAAIPPEGAGRLLHELQVHQIELEMQNEELRRAQQELEASRVKYFDLYDMAPVGYFTVGEKGLILEVNLRGAELLGVERNRLVKQPLTRYIVPEDQDVYYLHRKRLLETGSRQMCELRMCRQDAPPFRARLEMGAARDGGNWPPVCRIIVSDITEQKRAEEEFALSRQLLGLHFQQSPLAVIQFDIEGRVREWNPAAVMMFGFSREEAIGQHWTVIVPEPVWASLEGVWEGLLTRRGGSRSTNENRTKDGRTIHCEWYSTPLIDPDGKTIAVASLVMDITDRRRAEEEKRDLERQVQEKRKLESLGVLAGGIAHDFSNLLMVVLGHAELALKEISPMSPAHGNLTGITTAAQRAAELSLQMLAYAGKAVFAVERVGLRELVEEMAHLLKTAISKKAILTLHLERGLPPIEADSSQIRQIVMNLIINASEALGDRSGEITVSVGATRCDEEYLQKTELQDGLAPGLYVHLEVTDTGSGMDAQTRSRIFEPFFSTKFTGRGLGLAAVLGIVRAHKGALKVYSEPGKGTTFKILFPALEDAGEGARTNESSPLAEWRGKGTILLVDDEESLIDLGARMLEHLGFTVLTAADGLQTVELYRERGKEIDLVLMDLTMPHMDGAEAFGELRRLNPEVRVVLASGYSHEDVASAFAGKGLAGVLQKPYTLAKLRETLAGLLPKRLDGEG